MLAGQLRKRVVIQSRTSTQDSFGQQTIVWNDVLVGDEIGLAVDIDAVTAGTLTTFDSPNNGFTDGTLVTLAGIVGEPNLLATFAVVNADHYTFQVRFNSTGLTLATSGATATPVSGVPAAVMPLYAYEKQGQGQSSEVHQVTIRFHPLLEDPVEVAAMRVRYGARVLEINGSINIEERNREITLNCTEGLTQG